MRIERIGTAAAGSLLDRLAATAGDMLGPGVTVERGEGVVVLTGPWLRHRHMSDAGLRDLAITVARAGEARS